jgi:hypothetical protein
MMDIILRGDEKEEFVVKDFLIDKPSRVTSNDTAYKKLVNTE